ncbi:MAG: baseplate J/gp47 family protein [Candidatus Pristimantibacillus sp.]
MSLNNLPDINLVQVDADEIISNIIATYEALSGRKLFPADPIRLFLLSIANVIVQQQALMNDAARSNLLRYARGNVLDHIAALTETTRLDALAARTTVRFTLAAPQLSAVTIPIGTRTTPGNNLFFATTEIAEFPAGDLSVMVASECTTPGEIGNGYLVGQVNVLVDPIPFVAEVNNTTVSSGGTNTESDDGFRNRIHSAPSSFSVAGPSDAYEYWARSANPLISDVMVNSPVACEVDVYVLLTNGELPSTEIIEQVDAVVNDRRIRPLTDKVTVLGPTVVNYEIELEYWIDSSNAIDALTIQAAVDQAINDYILWQKVKIGRNINPSEITRVIMNAGAKRVSIVTPAYTVLDNTQIAIIADESTDVIVTYGGIEND